MIDKNECQKERGIEWMKSTNSEWKKQMKDQAMNESMNKWMNVRIKKNRSKGWIPRLNEDIEIMKIITLTKNQSKTDDKMLQSSHFEKSEKKLENIWK